VQSIIGKLALFPSFSSVQNHALLVVMGRKKRSGELSALPDPPVTCLRREA